MLIYSYISEIMTKFLTNLRIILIVLINWVFEKLFIFCLNRFVCQFTHGRYPGQVPDRGEVPPSTPDRGYPQPGPTWGYSGQVRMGVPSIGTGWVTPHWDWMGVPPSGLDEGTPPAWTGWGYPHWDWMGVHSLLGLDGGTTPSPPPPHPGDRAV